jgi:hypothetical protein
MLTLTSSIGIVAWLLSLGIAALCGNKAGRKATFATGYDNGHLAGIKSEQDRLLDRMRTSALGDFATPEPPPLKNFTQARGIAISQAQRDAIADDAAAIFEPMRHPVQVSIK